MLAVGSDQTGLLTSTLVITTAGPLVAQNDRALTEKNLPVIIPVLNNDWDPNNDVLSLVDVGVPLSGMANLVYNTVVYTPTLDFVGTDTFTYTVSDGRFATPGVVSVIVAERLFRLYIPVWEIGPLPAQAEMIRNRSENLVGVRHQHEPGMRLAIRAK